MLYFFPLLVTARGACTQVRVDGYHWKPRVKGIHLGMIHIHLKVKPSIQSEGYSLESERYSLQSERHSSLRGIIYQAREHLFSLFLPPPACRVI